MKHFWYLCCAVLSLAGLLGGCSSAATNTPGDPAYPVPVGQGAGLLIDKVEGPDFMLNPIASGATTVSGTAPANLTFLIVDVTTMGNELGRVTSDASGNFEATLTEPAIATHQIGIQLDVDTQISPEVFKQLAAKGGANFRSYPNLGFIFESRLVDQ